MKKVLKWLGIAVVAVIAVIMIAVIAMYAVSSFRINKSYDIAVEQVPVGADEETLARGEHIAATRGCEDCHKQGYAGGLFIDGGPLATLYSSNLTAGRGGIGSTYTDADWVRAIRHGVGPDGKPLLFMPAQEYYYLSDEDLGALIAYMKTVPPVDNTVAESSVGPLGRALFLAGQFPLLPVEMVDHTAPRPVAPEPGVTAEYGQYMAYGCMGCHNPNFTGGPITGGDPSWPPAANLTPAGPLADYTEEQFIETMRSGLTPSGKQLNAEWMPWPTAAQMTDEELQAVWLFFNSLPATPTEG